MSVNYVVVVLCGSSVRALCFVIGGGCDRIVLLGCFVGRGDVVCG